MDSVSSVRRSKIMGLVRSRDTEPEMLVHRLVHSIGYRYRLSAKTSRVPLTWYSGRVGKRSLSMGASGIDMSIALWRDCQSHGRSSGYLSWKQVDSLT